MKYDRDNEWRRKPSKQIMEGSNGSWQDQEERMGNKETGKRLGGGEE